MIGKDGDISMGAHAGVLVFAPEDEVVELQSGADPIGGIGGQPPW
jgi:hypothetical protein